MTQPTGSTSLNSSWIAKGLKAGIYVTESGAFVFDDSASSVAASPDLSWTTNAANTGLSTPYSDLIIDPAGGGGTDIGYLHATNGMSAAFGDNMTFVFDCSPPVVGAGSYDNQATVFFNWGSSALGNVQLRGTPLSGGTIYRVEFLVRDVAYGAIRSAYIDFNTQAHRRIAFRYRRGYPVDIFVGGSIQTAGGRTDDYSAATPAPGETKRLLGWRPYTITPTASHLHIFNTALSDTDIAALAADPWQVYGAGGGGVTTTITATLAGVVGSVANTGSTANGTFTSEVLKDYAGNILSNVSLNFVRFYNDTTGALVLNKTGISTNGSGIVTFSDAALVAGTTYRVDWETAAGSRRMPRKAAS